MVQWDKFGRNYYRHTLLKINTLMVLLRGGEESMHCAHTTTFKTGAIHSSFLISDTTTY